MSRVITFSTVFPMTHPKRGVKTYSVEKLAKSLHQQGQRPWDIPDEIFSTEMYYLCEPKHHTIRAGNRWKVGDKFSPRIWSGKPYASKQIVIAPDIEIKSIQGIRIEVDKDYSCVFIDEYPFYEENENFVTQVEAFETLAKNDGLSVEDFRASFKIHPKEKKGFKGQTICWNENIKY